MARLGQIAPELRSADLNKAVAFYEQKLGFKVALRFAANESWSAMELPFPCSPLADRNRRRRRPHLTSDLDQLNAEFEPSGATITVRIELKPWGNREFRVRDECGHELKFTDPFENDAA